MTFIEPLDFETLFVDMLSGSSEIFLGILVVLISILAAKFKLPTVAIGFSFVILGLFMAGTQAFSGVYILGLIIGGMVTFLWASEIWKR